MVRRNRNILVERERRQEAQEYEKELKQKQEFLERKRQKPISIQVQILTGRKIQLLIDARYDHLLDIKKKIQIKEGIHPDQQILLLNGIRLKDGLACDLHIEDGACLFLTLRNRGG